MSEVTDTSTEPFTEDDFYNNFKHPVWQRVLTNLRSVDDELGTEFEDYLAKLLGRSDDSRLLRLAMQALEQCFRELNLDESEIEERLGADLAEKREEERGE
jgi:hypothetical protein